MLQEFVAVKEGIKPVSFIGSTKLETNKKITKLCSEYNLCITKKNDEYKTIIISKNRSLAEMAYKYWVKKEFKKLGKLLGYPNCCIDFYVDYFMLKEIAPTIKDIFSRSKKAFFYTNNIFNFNSRLVLKGKEIDFFLKNKMIFDNISSLYLIPHIPCSYDCKESVEIGKNILKSLRKFDTTFAKKIEFYLKKPIIWFDLFRWIVFDGKVNRNEIKYTKILPLKSIYPKKELDEFKKGNKAILTENKIKIFKDDKLLFNLPKNNGVIIDFS